MDPIKLSILIPTYNFKSGINRILIALNLLKRIYMIIWNNISDDSDKVIVPEERNEYLKKSFKNYIYTHNNQSLGAVNNWNKLISIAKGNYVGYCIMMNFGIKKKILQDIFWSY